MRTINPNDLAETKEALAWGMNNEGVSVVITRWPCALKKFSQADKDEFTQAFKKKCVVNTDKCIGCKACLKSGCPAMVFNKDVEGKASILSGSCLGCEVCMQICPVGAIEVEGE